MGGGDTVEVVLKDEQKQCRSCGWMGPSSGCRRHADAIGLVGMPNRIEMRACLSWSMSQEQLGSLERNGGMMTWSPTSDSKGQGRKHQK